MDVMRFKAEGAAGEASVRFAEGDPLFEGHFPGAPVLPGVALVDAAVELAARALGRPLRLERVASVKFVSAVRPGQTLELAYRLAEDAGDPGRVSVSARWSRGGERVAEVSLSAVTDGPEEVGA